MFSLNRIIKILVILQITLLGNLGWAEEFRVGVWNIENLSPTAKRGFPELTGQNQFGPRNTDQLKDIADYIRNDVQADALVITEIHADIGTQTEPRSSHLDTVVSHLGNNWNYILGRTGGKQRVGFLFDSNRVKLKKIIRFPVGEFKVQGKDIYDRDPLLFWVALLDDSHNEAVDFLCVGLHLKSQQKFIHNHMVAVGKLFGDLRENSVREDLGIPKKSVENDIVIMGDLNDSAHTRTGFNYIFDYLEAEKYLHQGGNLVVYPDTRVNGSQIDHIFVTKKLFNNFVEQNSFQSYTVLENESFNYRRTFSDHFPVTIDMQL